MSTAFLTICLNPVIQKSLQLKKLNNGEVNRTNKYRSDASGKGINVTRVLSQLGADVTHLTHVGGSSSELFLDMVAQDNLKITTVDSNSEIRTCYTLLDRSNNSTTEIVEEAKPVDIHCEEKFLIHFRRIMSIYDYVIISGTKAAGYSDQIIPTIVREAKSAGKKVILDVKGEDLINCIRYKPDIIKPNLDEFTDTFTGKNIDEKLVELGNLGIKSIITDGINPIKYYDCNEVKSVQVSVAKETLNTTGCGDSFTAGLAYALSLGLKMNEAISEAQKCAKLNAINFAPGVIRE